MKTQQKKKKRNASQKQKFMVIHKVMEALNNKLHYERTTSGEG